MELQKTMKPLPDSTFSTMLRLVFEEGGNVPEKYSGLYQSRAKAKAAIVEYEREMKEKKYYPSAPTPKKDDPKPKAKAPVNKEAPKPEPEAKTERVTNDGEETDIS